MDGKVSVSNIALTESDKLPLYATFLAGYRVGGFQPEVEVVLFILNIQDMVLRKMKDVIGQAGHANFPCRH
jgi:hypothetical protein